MSWPDHILEVVHIKHIFASDAVKTDVIRCGKDLLNRKPGQINKITRMTDESEDDHRLLSKSVHFPVPQDGNYISTMKEFFQPFHYFSTACVSSATQCMACCQYTASSRPLSNANTHLHLHQSTWKSTSRATTTMSWNSNGGNDC